MRDLAKETVDEKIEKYSSVTILDAREQARGNSVEAKDIDIALGRAGEVEAFLPGTPKDVLDFFGKARQQFVDLCAQQRLMEGAYSLGVEPHFVEQGGRLTKAMERVMLIPKDDHVTIGELNRLTMNLRRALGVHY